MQIEGKLINHLPTQSGEGKNGSWEKGGFVIETPDAKYPKKIAFVTWGETVGTAGNIALGTNVKVDFEVESREYNAKWFTDAKAFKVQVNLNGSFVDPQPKTVTPKRVDDTPQPTLQTFDNSDLDSLPF